MSTSVYTYMTSMTNKGNSRENTKYFVTNNRYISVFTFTSLYSCEKVVMTLFIKNVTYNLTEIIYQKSIKNIIKRFFEIVTFNFKSLSLNL
jgi:hypothetical protein